ncbi:MAG: PHP domain-containing protein [Candidatus Firestonebacteria bacterium]
MILYLLILIDLIIPCSVLQGIVKSFPRSLSLYALNREWESRKNKTIWILVYAGFFIFLFINYSIVESVNTPIKLKAIIHVHSSVSSDKANSFDYIAKLAREKNIDVVFFTDHDIMKWEYGILPFRNVFKKTVEKGSILKYGPAKYLEDINEVRQKYSDVIIIAGAESSPFYYWEGSFFKRNLSVDEWNKHLLVLGLDNSVDYRNLPLVSNRNAGRYDLYSLLKFSPIFFLVLGIWIFLLPKVKHITYKDRAFIVERHFIRPLGGVVIVISLIFAINNYPYKHFEFDQYHKDKRESPYQNLINYVSEKGGLIFWAHPEADYLVNIGWLKILTPKYTDYLLATDGWTGFSALSMGYKIICQPKGIWDKILLEYCRGERKKPVWAIGELEYEGGNSIGSIFTILFAKEKTKDGVLQALKSGSMYAFQKNIVYLDLVHFSVNDGENKANMGEEITVSKSPLIKIKITSDMNYPIEIRLFKNGEVIKTFNTITGEEINYTDNNPLNNGLNYYRFDAISDGSILVSNPIFIR